MILYLIPIALIVYYIVKMYANQKVNHQAPSPHAYETKKENEIPYPDPSRSRCLTPERPRRSMKNIIDQQEKEIKNTSHMI